MDLWVVALRSFWAAIETLWEILHWRDDWDRTWSPVSWWLMAFFVAFLLVLVLAILQPRC
jgi:hypothetical protein